MNARDDPGVLRIRRFWEARAREDALRYSAPFGGVFADDAAFLRSGEDVLDDVDDRVGWDPAGVDLVLDVGCGAGRLTRALAERAIDVLSVDVAPSMLAAARARHPGLDNARWALGHAGDLLDVPTRGVDAVVMLGVLPHLPGVSLIVDALGEVARVLRPEGGCVFDVRDGPGPLRLPGEGSVPDRVLDHPLWAGTVVDLETLAALAAQHRLLLERIEGSGTGRCLVLARREYD